MRVLGLGFLGIVFSVGLAACDGDEGGGSSGTGGAATGGSSATGGSGGVAGSASGGAAGSASGGTAGSATGGSGGTGGSSATCSVLSWDGCAVLRTCMEAKCDAQIAACYGASYKSDNAAGSKCESLWTCSKTCTCGDNGCLVNTCYSTASADCQSCIPAITSCLTANCSAEAQQC